MTKEYVIYALLDPRTDEMRYIGMTMDVKGREHDHSIAEGAGYYGKWKRSLLKIGLKPKLVVLEENLSREQASEREQYWIAYGRENGWRLTNLTEGGEFGCPGYKHTKEARAKIADAQRGRSWNHTPEAKAKIGEASKQQPRSKAWRKAISKALTGKPHPHDGIPRSEECRAKIGALHKGMRHTEEAKAKIGAYWRGRTRSPETRQRMKEAAIRREARKRAGHTKTE